LEDEVHREVVLSVLRGQRRQLTREHQGALRSLNFTIVRPATCCFEFQFRWINCSIVVRYSGQQKLPTSRYPPVPPPPVVSPKPTPRAPVSATLDPSCGSAPSLGRRPRASGGASFTRGLGAGFALAAGIVISGALAAGGAIGVLRSGSAGAGACTGRPPIGVIPPALGPGAPPRLICITSRSTGPSGASDGIARNATTSTMCAARDTTTIRFSPPGSRVRATRMSVTASIY
jgi:hypothetical protein